MPAIDEYNITATITGLKEILPFRSLHIQEINTQVRYDSVHERGWSDSYIIACNDIKIGYGAIKGNESRSDRNTIFEFYIVPSYRDFSEIAFSALVKVSQAVFLECQSNDLQLVTWLYQYTFNIHSDVILFEDSFVSNLNVQDVIFRRRTGNDIIFEHTFEPVGDYVLESNGKVIATGGFLLHYNFPFADLFVEVKEEFQRKGIGSFLTQELKRECYLAGRVPSARCNMDNFASKATMLKAGYRISGFMLLGRIKSGKV